MSNKNHRRELENYVETFEGIPLFLHSTVKMLRLAFPSGLTINSDDFYALWSFLEDEEFTNRAIASTMDYAFDLNYMEVFNSYGGISDSDIRIEEIKRIEKLLSNFGLDEWRKEPD